ncbi:MAG: Sec-independent protein translocase subunit TatA/TatB [Isosphaeraceae bacterium]
MLPQLGLLEMLIVMGVAVLLFGKRLPEVGRSLGRGIVEFKKGLNGVADELDDNSSSSGSISSYSSNHSSTRRYDEKPHGEAVYSDASVPKFELPGTASSSAPQMDYPQQPPQE